MNQLSDLSDTSTYVLYDGECPVCSRYTRFVRFRETVGEVVLLNCREYPTLLADLKTKGFNLNDGMLLSYQGQLFYGDKAVYMMATLSTPHNACNRLNAMLFRNPTTVKYIYPVMVLGRKALLMLLRKKPL
jgi:predicted DCC family thiol-disulfide oxidoreductase YuxK